MDSAPERSRGPFLRHTALVSVACVINTYASHRFPFSKFITVCFVTICSPRILNLNKTDLVASSAQGNAQRALKMNILYKTA